MSVLIFIENNKIETVKDVKSFKPQTELQKKVIGFCLDWMNGKSEFEIKTSGSTGKPKSIFIKRIQMEKSAEMTAQKFNLNKADKLLLNLNIENIAGLMMLARGLHLGLDIIVTEPSSNPIKNIDQKIDFFAFVPLQLQKIIEENEFEILKEAKAIIVGGAQPTDYQMNLFQKANLPIFLTYGMTETCTHIAVKKITESEYRALNNVHFQVDERGCLIIFSPTAIESPLVTNDVVDLKSETSFVWKGRFDNVINSGGMKIQIESLEAKIGIYFNNNNFKNRFIITSKSDNVLGEKIILIIEGTPISFDFSFLNKYEQPKEVFFVDEFKETPTGKIDRLKYRI